MSVVYDIVIFLARSSIVAMIARRAPAWPHFSSTMEVDVPESAKTAADFDQNFSIPRTLNRLARMARGWAQHYSFCNDIQTVKDVDEKMHAIYTGYAQKAQAIASKHKAGLAAVILGYTGAASVDFKPLRWPE